MEAHDFETIVRERLAETGETAIGAARRAGLPRDAIRSVLRGHPPNLLRAKKICDALGLALQVGLPHEIPPLGETAARDAERRSHGVSPDLERHTQGLVRAVAAAGGDPIPPEMRAALRHHPLEKRPANPAVETGTAVRDPGAGLSTRLEDAPPEVVETGTAVGIPEQ